MLRFSLGGAGLFWLDLEIILPLRIHPLEGNQERWSFWWNQSGDDQFWNPQYEGEDLQTTVRFSSFKNAFSLPFTPVSFLFHIMGIAALQGRFPSGK